MTVPVQSFQRMFEALRERAFKATEGGRLEEALGLHDQAVALAEAHGDILLVDRAFCSRTSVAIELGQAEGAMSRLREILLRDADPINSHSAAYQIARLYEVDKAYKKALFYARMARDHALVVGRADWIAFCHNQIGNVLLAESHVPEARWEYETALELAPPERSVWHARILDNLGYCRILEGRHQEGFRLLYQSLRTLRHLGVDLYQISTRIDLCFAHLEVGRYRDALRHGKAALTLAETHGDTDATKNALYLVGEASRHAGRLGKARVYFGRLQEYYPEHPFVSDLLMSVDVRKMINLKA